MTRFLYFAVIGIACAGCASSTNTQVTESPTASAQAAPVSAGPTATPTQVPPPATIAPTAPSPDAVYVAAFKKAMEKVTEVEKASKTHSADLGAVRAELAQIKADYLTVPVPAKFAKVDSYFHDGLTEEKLAFDFMELAIKTDSPATAKVGEEHYVAAGESFKKALDELRPFVS